MDSELEKTKKELIDIFEQLLGTNNETLSNIPFISNPKLLNDLESIVNNYQRDIFEIINLEKYLINFALNDSEVHQLNDIIQVLKAFKDNQTLVISTQTSGDIVKNNSLQKALTLADNYSKKCSQLKENINQITTLLNYIKNLDTDSYFEKIDTIDNFMRNSRTVDLRTKYRINMLVGKYNILQGIKKQNYTLTDKDIIKLSAKNRLSYEELKQVFEKYNYNIELINDDIINRLLTLGNINDIDYILSWFESINLHLNETKKQDQKYFHMLYKSSEEIIERMVECSKELNISITDLFKKSFSAFIHKSNKKSPHTINPKEDGNNYNISGSHEDFIENKKLIEELGYDIIESYQKCATIFVFSNKLLKENVNALEQYGINVREHHENIKLSGLKNTEILFTIDQFIELDELGYLTQNTSRLLLNPNDVIFYRLYKAKKENVSYESDFNFDKKVYKSFISQDSLGNSFVRRSNKQEDTNTITPKVFDEDTESVIEKTIATTNIVYDEDLLQSNLIKELDKSYLSNDELAYTIANKRFSKFKLLRLLTLLNDMSDELDMDESDKLLYCLTYNSILTEEEYNDVKKELLEKVKEKRLI